MRWAPKDADAIAFACCRGALGFFPLFIRSAWVVALSVAGVFLPCGGCVTFDASSGNLIGMVCLFVV